METKEAMLRKVRGLLAKAEDPACTPEEAEAFSRKAETLIAKYAIDLALIEEKTGRGKPTTIRVETEKNYRMPFVGLLDAVARGFGCKMILDGDGRKFATLVGFENDLDAVQTLYASLLLQATNGMLHDSKEAGVRGDALWRFKQSFLVGFGHRVRARLQELRQTTKADEPGTALVLRDRSQDVAKLFADLFPEVREVNGARAFNPAAYRSGESHADRADLGGQRVKGGRRQIA